MNYPLYWIRSSNFGDALNKDLYKLVTHREPEWSEDSPKILAAGSLMHKANPYDIVWGTGIMSEDLPINADLTTDFRAVRGRLTAKILRDKGLDVPDVYGDPMSLLPNYYPGGKVIPNSIGIVPHYVDNEIVRGMQLPDNCRIIGSINPLEMVDQILSCENIISSSLHGLIVAEAYGIPAVWVEFSDNVAGRGFKFRDYYSGTNREHSPLDLRHQIDIDQCDFNKFCAYDQLFASACPFNEEYSRWRSDPKTWPDWNSRYEIIGKMVKQLESVIEFGAGRGDLKKYLPTYCSYVPTDKFQHPGILQLDIENDPIIPGGDVAVLAGVLEYIKDVGKAIYSIWEVGIEKVIFSYKPYNPNEHSIDWRRGNGWINDYQEYELLLEFGKRYFYPVERREWNGQAIYRMERK